MKKNLIALAIVNVAALAGIGGANAQMVSSSSLPEQKNIIEINKTTMPVRNSIRELAPISPRALRNFANTYKNVTDESWLQVKNGFAVRFNSDGAKSTIFYNKNGDWVSSIKIYHEEKMDREIRHIVKSSYYDYKIIYTQEVVTIESEGVPTYIVCLEDNTNIKFVIINAGEMSVWKELTKAN